MLDPIPPAVHPIPPLHNFDTFLIHCKPSPGLDGQHRIWGLSTPKCKLATPNEQHMLMERGVYKM